MRNVIVASLGWCCLVLAACGDGDDEGGPDAPSPDALSATIDAPPIDPCLDGVRSGDETDVDCGGSCPARCALAQRCDDRDDCAQGGGGRIDCASEASCDTDDDSCVRVCLEDVDYCYPNPCSADQVCSWAVLGGPDDGPLAYCRRRHQPGEYCETGDRDLNDCIDGYTCQETDVLFQHTCQPAPTTPLAPVEASCPNDRDCEHGLFCNYLTLRCEVRAELGAPCFQNNTPCQPSLKCTFPADLACDIWIDCGSGMACCATETGAECRPGRSTQCTPPLGSCERSSLSL